ncbi:MAG: TRAP transporter small permease [Granulosicoccus sp.]
MTSWNSLLPTQTTNSIFVAWLLRLATLSGAIGGLIILVVAFVVSVSIIMRNVGLRGISGDFELVQMSCVFAAGLFLPLCQIKKGHVMVDLFTAWLPSRAIVLIDKFWTLVFAVAWFYLFFYMFDGLAEIKEYGDRSMLLKLPMWWSFIPGILGTGLSGVIAVTQIIGWHEDVNTSVVN